MKDHVYTEQTEEYILKNWCCDEWAATWCAYGRRFFHEDQGTTNLVKRLTIISVFSLGLYVIVTDTEYI